MYQIDLCFCTPPLYRSTASGGHNEAGYAGWTERRYDFRVLDLLSIIRSSFDIFGRRPILIAAIKANADVVAFQDVSPKQVTAIQTGLKSKYSCICTASGPKAEVRLVNRFDTIQTGFEIIKLSHKAGHVDVSQEVCIVFRILFFGILLTQQDVGCPHRQSITMDNVENFWLSL